MRTGYDSADAASVPAGGDIYLGYIDGDYQSYAPMRARFPGALVVPIAVRPTTNAGLIFDGPPDNATWPQVVGWVSMRRQAGVDPTVYLPTSQLSAAMAAFRAAGVDYPHWWIAQWDGNAAIPAGAVGKQYQSFSNRYDVSVFADYWPGVDPASQAPGSGGNPAPGQPATPAGDDDVAFVMAVQPDPTGGTGTGYFLVSGALIAHLTSGNDVANLNNAGVKTASIAPATYQEMLTAASALQGTLSGSLAVSGNLNVGAPAAS